MREVISAIPTDEGRRQRGWIGGLSDRVGPARALSDAAPLYWGLRGLAALVAATLLLLPTPGRATIYEVGTGQPFEAIGDVPWESLVAGDEVRIHHRATPYAEKIVLCVAGTQALPVVIRGMPGPGGELPVLTGENATTRPQVNFWSEARGVVKVGGANTPACDMATWVEIENLEIRSARPPFTFTGRDGLTSYPNNAAAVFVEAAEHLVLRNLVLHDSGNGLFVAAAGGDTQDILVEGCHIHDNGNVGSIYEHNSYTAARGIVFQGNHYGPLRAGCGGNNLKDRSAGLVVRYNLIESGNRQLDLVDAEDSAVIQLDPRYRATFVYGNVLVEPDGAGNSQIVHYGGDSGDAAIYRKGTLHFFHNTVVSTRTGNTTLFRLSTNDEAADARNNVFHVTAAGTSLGLLDSAGQLSLSHNWLTAGYVASHGTLTGAVLDDGSGLTGSEPGFVSLGTGDYHPGAGSVCIDQGGVLAADASPDHQVISQFLAPRGMEPRPVELPLDLGAFERCVSGSCPTVDPDGGVGADGGGAYDGGVAIDGGVSADAATGADSGTGTDAAEDPDSAPDSDGGAPPDPRGSSGCDCGVQSGGAGGQGLALVILCVGVVWGSRRRRPR